MTTDQVLALLVESPGSMRVVVIETPVQTLKSVQGVSVVKRSQLYVTAGTEYQNHREIREAIAAGLRGQVQPLPWGYWVTGKYPYVIGHTPKSGFRAGLYTEYVRAFPPSEEQLKWFNLNSQVQFFANGKEVTRAQAIEFCGSKADADDNHKAALALTVPYIVSVQ